jgi:hypothetical protein
MPIPKIGETISAEKFKNLYPVGTTLSANEFQQKYGGVSIVEQPTSGYTPSFPINPEEGYLKTATKTIGNIPKSGVNFIENIVSFLNPLNTIKTAQQLGEELGTAREEMGGWGKVTGGITKEFLPSAYETLTPEFLKRAFGGDIEGSARIVTEDPVGQLAPILLIAREGAKAKGRVAEFDSAVSRIASPGTKIVNPLLRFSSDMVKKGVDFVVNNFEKLAPRPSSPLETMPKPIPGVPKYIPKPLDLAQNVKLSDRLTKQGKTAGSILKDQGFVSTTVPDVFLEAVKKIGTLGSQLQQKASSIGPVSIKPFSEWMDTFKSNMRKIKANEKADFASEVQWQLETETFQSGGNLPMTEIIKWKNLFDTAKFEDPATAQKAKQVYFEAANGLRKVIEQYPEIKNLDAQLTEIYGIRDATQKAMPKVNDAMRKYEQAVATEAIRATDVNTKKMVEYEQKLGIKMREWEKQKNALPSGWSPRQLLEFGNRVLIPFLLETPSNVIQTGQKILTTPLYPKSK